MALKDRVTISLNEMKTWLDISTDDTRFDDTIRSLITVGLEQADEYLQNDFQTENENGDMVNEPVPDSITLAVKKMVASWLANRTDDHNSFSLGDEEINIGVIPWDSQRLLNPYKRFVGL